MKTTSLLGRGVRPALRAAAAALLAVASAGAAGAVAGASPDPSTASTCGHLSGAKARVGHFGGIARAVAVKSSCQHASEPAIGTPPLLFHGGPVMGTHTTGAVVVTPVFWTPAGHAIPADYQKVITTYLGDVAAASGQRSNVYSTLAEYFGTNGAIRYRIALRAALTDTNPLPVSGCTLEGADKSKIYGDRSGYDACLDDNQIIAETDAVVSSRGLPRDLAHIYVMFLPKHVESCFYPGSTKTAANFCTINHQPSAAYCAYHSQAGSGTVYANMPFPVYSSPVGYTCGTEKDFGSIQSPNGNPDADVEISPTSHEIMEAITDPDTVTGWYDSSGYENGDECAYVFGPTSGTAGQLYNQVIGTRHYLTQEEFSNADFARTGGGCLQHT